VSYVRDKEVFIDRFEYRYYSCPLCDSSNCKELFSDRNRRDNINCFGTYVKCGKCSLVYLRYRPPWDQIIKFYSLLDSDITANAGRIDTAIVQKQLKRPVGKWKLLLRKVRFRPHSWPVEASVKGNNRLLDVGCGNGAKLYEFAERGYEIWGVDIGADATKVCRDLLPQGHFVQGELQKADLPSDYFDHIRIDNALEHVPNPKEVVQKCYYLLRKGGKLLIYVPHGRSLSMRVMKGSSISSWIPFHLLLFTKGSLKLLMKKAGFNDIHVYGYYPSSWLPLSFVQWLNRKQSTSTFDYPSWLDCLFYPLGWFLSKVGLAEELVVTGRK